MLSDPKVGVLLPVYNAKPYLEECIVSIKAQSYFHLDIFAVDDCSTDDSFEELDRLLGYHKRNLVNQGWANTYNRAADFAIGNSCEYLFIMGADDVISKNTIMQMVDTMKREDTDFVVCEGQMFGERSDFMTAGNPTSWREFEHANLLPNFCLIKASVWQEMGGYDPEFSDNGGYADWELWIRLFKAGKKLAVIHEPLYLYRMHPGQVHRKADNQLWVNKIHKKHFNT